MRSRLFNTERELLLVAFERLTPPVGPEAEAAREKLLSAAREIVEKFLPGRPAARYSGPSRPLGSQLPLKGTAG